jgi:hypothetical protein
LGSRSGLELVVRSSPNVQAQQVHRNGQPVAAFGVGALGSRRLRAGVGDPYPPAAHHAPWKDALVTTVVTVATGWALEEIARRTFRKKRSR